MHNGNCRMEIHSGNYKMKIAKWECTMEIAKWKCIVEMHMQFNLQLDICNLVHVILQIKW
jgi:ribosome-associated toxin RatA of RatAB toxin-antitoxin module